MKNLILLFFIFDHCFSITASANFKGFPPSTQWESLQTRIAKVSAQIEIIQQQIEALDKIAHITQSLNTAAAENKSLLPLELKKNNEDILNAKHCLQDLSQADINSGTSKKAEKKKILDEPWNMHCALSFSHATVPNLHVSLKISRTEFDTFAYTTFLRNGSDVALRRSLILAAGFANQGRELDALHFLNEDASRSPVDSKWLPRVEFTRALLLYKLKKLEGATEIFEHLAAEKNIQAAQVKIQSAVPTEIQQLAQVQLARISYADGNFEAAEAWYRLAIAQVKQSNSEEPPPLLWEFALTLHRLKKYDESLAIFARFLNVRLTALQAAKIMSHSKTHRSLAMNRLSAILAFAETDLLYLENANGMDQINFEENVRKLKTLIAVAGQYQIKTEDISEFLKINSVLQNAPEKLRNFNLQVVQMLNPAEVAENGILDVRSQSIFNQLAQLQKKLVGHIFELDEISAELWMQPNIITTAAKKNRQEIIRRLQSFDDIVDRVLHNQKKQAEFNIFKSNSEKMQKLLVKLRRDNARLASLKSINTSEETPDLQSLAQDLENIEDKSTQILLSQRAFILKDKVPKLDSTMNSERMNATEDSFHALFLLHQRVYIKSDGIFDDDFFSRLDNVWAMAIQAEKNISITADRELISARTWHATLVSELSSLLDLKKIENAELNQLKRLLLKDAKKWIATLSLRIQIGILEYKNEVKIALALANSHDIKDLKQKNAEFMRASEERKKWLQSVQQSVDFGFAR